MKFAVLVPTYNEVANIDVLLQAIDETTVGIEDAHFTVVVVDDSSPDGTAEVVERLSGSLAREGLDIVLLRKPVKEGLGAAYQFGYEFVMPKLDPDYVIQMDADLSHNPKYLTGFVQQTRAGADLVVASRYIPGGGAPDWGLRRRALSFGGNFYARMMLGRQVTDYTGSFMVMSKSLVIKVDVASIEATGYGFMLVLKSRAVRLAQQSVEIPIVFIDRKHGSSKLPKNTLWVNFALVARMRLTRGRS